MHIKIIGVGKIKESYLQQGIAEYQKRIQPYARLQIAEVREHNLPAITGEKELNDALDKEAHQICRLMRDEAYTIVLAIEGNLYSSEKFASKLNSLALSGNSNLDIVIGGPDGLHSGIKKKAGLLLSFSRMTFPHQLMRLVLLEQVYRAFKIIRKEPYHK